MFKHQETGPMRHRKINQSPTHAMGGVLVEMADLFPTGLVILNPCLDDPRPAPIAGDPSQLPLPAVVQHLAAVNERGSKGRTVGIENGRHREGVGDIQVNRAEPHLGIQANLRLNLYGPFHRMREAGVKTTAIPLAHVLLTSASPTSRIVMSQYLDLPPDPPSPS